MRRYSSLIVRVCCFLMLITATSAFAATVAVGTCQPGKVSFDSLDDAVNGVPDGSTILVCPGIYQEQIVINRSLTMKAVANGNTSLVAIVPPPGGLTGNQSSLFVPISFFGGGTQLAAQVTIINGANVTLNGITIDAQGPITCQLFSDGRGGLHPGCFSDVDQHGGQESGPDGTRSRSMLLFGS